MSIEMQNKKVAIFTLTRKGYSLGKKILNLYNNSKLYTLKKYSDDMNLIYDEGFKESVKKEFLNSDLLIFISATGIVVRTIAEFMVSKKTDPAVIAIDDNGNNVISLLSGHIGGANYFAKQIADYIKSNPVITTASDVNGKPSVDMIAIENNLILKDFEKAKLITSMFVNEEDVLCICSDKTLSDTIQKKYNLKIIKNNELNNSLTKVGKLFITNEEIVEGCDEISSILYIKNLVIGLGCKRDTSKEDIISFIKETFKSNNKSLNSIKHIATVDIKENEIGIIETAKEFCRDLIIVSRDEIRNIQDRYIGSDFVYKTIGVRSVSEPVAELTSLEGRFLIKKKIKNGITLSVWEEINE
ncbi:cobalt-precorrin 5A hydrolase [Helicovermis profundi]|uniref:Cobalt-precorrin 5A hydrolase n=1 Tax=Helicovermis profundi TaxID=3065157 RepID=A0AAU9E0K1_9FIRM|nr:cobalt-precorrin 5A hydrolase [Clostridia bacterium S502]